jgi:hypothetical protein
MGTHKKKLFSGPLYDGYSQPHKKRQKQLVETGLCRDCGDSLGRAKTICDTCANKAAAVEAERREADKAAERKEAVALTRQTRSPNLAPPPSLPSLTSQLSNICQSLGGQGQLRPIAIDWKEELRTGRIRVQLLYSNPNRRQAEQVEAALQEWDLTHNQPGAGRRFSLHQRWYKNFTAKECEGHVLLVEVTKQFFAAHEKAVFVLKASGLHVGPDGKAL